jgi:sortase A
MIDEEDLVKIFSQKKSSPEIAEQFMGILTKLIFLTAAISLSYIFINFYGFKDKILFWYQNDFKEEPSVHQSAQPDVTEIKTKEGKPVENKTVIPDMPDNSIRIPSIDIDAPLTWRVNNLPKEVSQGLSKGVIHINGTALPGQKGNVYITGHSSNYVWIRQKYNSIFSNISKLVVGDIIYVKFGSEVYTYKVFDQKVVSSKDLSILNPTNDSRLTLATCWPLGTSLKRMVILANQISPSPSKNKPSKEVIQFTKLPGVR